MNLEKLAREIAMCKSPNVDKWLVPIVDLEGMITLIQRQESELAASRDENETIKAASAAGEFPPLPEPHPTHYRERGMTLERLEMYTDEQMREYGRLCRAAQPVQQPAAVPTQYGLAAYAQANADFRPAPILSLAAAVVGELLPCPHCGDQPIYGSVYDPDERRYMAMDISCCASMTASVRWPAFAKMTDAELVAELQRQLKEDWNKRTAPVPPAGVQGDVIAILQECLEWLSQHEKSMLSSRPFIWNALQCNDLQWRVLKVKNSLVPAPQSDSGRDAALKVLEYYADNYDMMARIGKTGDVDCKSVAYDIRRNMVDGVRAALAAHPAPSSDAALVDALRNIRDYRTDMGDSIAARSMRFYAEEALAAHPANGAQAGHQAPFMYAIKGPDGSAYIDENCVSATEEGLYLEVNGLNDSPDAGYSIVPVFLADAPQKKEG